MIRGALLAFILGWATWFWLDKNPAVLGPLPFPRDGDMLGNFQMFIDLLKQSRFKAAFVYIWKAHYLLLSVAVGVLLGMIGGSIARARARRRFVSLYLPEKKSGGAPGEE